MKDEASRLGIPVFQPEKARQPDAVARIAAEAPDLIVVVAYGHILPKSILDIPRAMCVNVHASLLPKYRGAAPINWAVARGETETGVTIMKMDEGMDTGPILHVRKMSIGDEDTAESMYGKLSVLGAEALVEALARLRDGTLSETPQDGAAGDVRPDAEEGAREDRLEAAGAGDPRPRPGDDAVAVRHGGPRREDDQGPLVGRRGGRRRHGRGSPARWSPPGATGSP